MSERPPLEHRFGQKVAIEVKTMQEYLETLPKARETLIRGMQAQTFAVAREPDYDEYVLGGRLTFTQPAPVWKRNKVYAEMGYEFTLMLSTEAILKYYPEEAAAADAKVAGL